MDRYATELSYQEQNNIGVIALVVQKDAAETLRSSSVISLVVTPRKQLFFISLLGAVNTTVQYLGDSNEHSNRPPGHASAQCYQTNRALLMPCADNRLLRILKPKWFITGEPLIINDRWFASSTLNLNLSYLLPWTESYFNKAPHV